MKKIYKRWISLLCILGLLLGMCPVPVFATGSSEDLRLGAFEICYGEISLTDGGDYPWVLSKDDSIVGCHALKTSNQGKPSSTSELTITFTAKRPVTITFDYKVFSEKKDDTFTVLRDGTVFINKFSGKQSGHHFSGTLAAGTHELTLSYSKDHFTDAQIDTCYIYGIRIEPDCTHSWNDGEITLPPSCTDGIRTYTCRLCTSTRSELIPALEHSWDTGAVTTPPSCLPGSMTYTCTLCGDTKTERIPGTGHNYVGDLCTLCGGQLTHGEMEIVGEWVWGDTVAELGAEEIAARCAENGITDIYLLVKRADGTLDYRNTQYTDRLARPSRDVLKSMISAGHAKGIRVHAWLNVMEDAVFKAEHPEAGLWHYIHERDNDRITPYDPTYRRYMISIANELAMNYNIDGIHLDDIRYDHACNGWSEEDLAALAAMGADVEKIKYLVEKTFYGVDGVAADNRAIFDAYCQGDPDVLRLAQYRRNNVVSLASAIRDAVKFINPSLLFSGVIMAEGLYDEAFADLHYGQSYGDTPELYDYVVPMSYSPSDAYTSDQMAEMALQCVAQGNNVVMGLLSMYPTQSEQLQGDLEAIRGLVGTQGVLGICHFRHSSFSYAKLNYDTEMGKIKVQAISTYGSEGWKWVRFEAAEGVRFTGATVDFGLAADAPVEIAPDGSWIKIGYADDADREVLPPLSRGRLCLTFEGVPVDPYARIAYARVFLESGEGLVYSTYNRALPATVTFIDYDGTVVDRQYVPIGEAAKAPKNPSCRLGYRFVGWDRDFSRITEDLTVTAVYRQIAPMESYGEFDVVGVWVFGSDVATLGADTIVESCAKNGITDIYVLVKGTGGTLGYNKTQYTENIAYEQDVLQEMVEAGHAVGIRIHAWICVVEDEAYKTAHPESGMWHYVRGQDSTRIHPGDEGYQTYMANIATEIATGYEVDGIHLDYIRYNHLATGWSEEDFANLEAMGANLENVRYLIERTFYGVGEEPIDSQYIFNALRNGDPDAILIAKYRRENITTMARNILDAAEAVNPDLIFSASFQAEGAVTEGPEDVAFADLHFGQNYADAVGLYDYICPLAITGIYAAGSAEWFAKIAQYAIGLGNKVAMGVGAYYPATSVTMTEEIEALRQLLPHENILGIVHFRHSQFSYAKLNYSYCTGGMTVDIISFNNYPGTKWIQLDAAEGVHFTGAAYGEGFVADAPIEIAEDGSYVKFGYPSDGDDFVLLALGEGTLQLTFEGAPADPKAPIAIVRVYGTNESRAFNVYNYTLHQWDEGQFTMEPGCLEEGTMLYTCTVCGETKEETVAPKGHGPMVYCETVAPTCTETGVTDHWLCEDCGSRFAEEEALRELTAQELLIPVMDHSFDAGTVTDPATCTEDGIQTYICDTCGEVKQEAIPATGHLNIRYNNHGWEHSVMCDDCGDIYTEPHDFEEGNCVCGAATPTEVADLKLFHTLNLESHIAINYVVLPGTLDAYDSYYLECRVPVYEGNKLVRTRVLTLEAELRDGCYYFVLNGLISLEMNNMVQAQLCMTKGKEIFVSPVDYYSIATYAYSQLNNAYKPEALKVVCANLLQYGTKAQLWKGYRTDALADSAMTEAHRAYLTDLESVVFGNHKRFLGDMAEPTVAFVGMPLQLDSKIVVGYVINTTSYTGSREDLNLHITYEGSDGTVKTVILKELEAYYAAANYYVFRFDGLLAAELRSVMSVAVYEGETRISETVEYSVDTYGNGKTGTILTLIQAMIAYSDSAKAYFS